MADTNTAKIEAARVALETLARLEAAARKQTGLVFGTTIALMPGELLESVRLARLGIEAESHPAYLIDMATGAVEKL